ncbi:hypothetical protein DFH11DRAFT_1515480, partial [Phellopilus nigrolimitatus]
ALDAETDLLATVGSSTPIPAPRLLKLDHSASPVPSSYALLSHPLGTPLARAPPGDARSRARTDLRLGAHLRALHAVQNDWFGLPGAPGDWGECYSWQEGFAALLEAALADAARAAVGGVPAEALRRALGRAIGSFLFDDVEVPCLVWGGALEWDAGVFVSVRGGGGAEGAEGAEGSSPGEEDGEITGLAGWGGALWGDPLMEGAFRAPSAALLEGYGGSPIVFARQHTKRLWYTAYAALRTLVAIAEEAAAGAGGAHALPPTREWDAEKTRALLDKTVELLKDAPCY